LLRGDPQDAYSDFERRFAEFLDKAGDVLRFSAIGTTKQGESGTQFRVDYLKSSGAIGFYHPDWVVVQKTEQGEDNWIVETKGRIWEGPDHCLCPRPATPLSPQYNSLECCGYRAE
jgi:hypothetical protein